MPHGLATEAQGEIARRVLVTAQSIGELIGSLEERGLVERPPTPDGAGAVPWS